MTFTTFIKRPVLSTVISIAIVLLGFIGLVSLPIEQYPNIAPPTVVVQTQYPGADAETVKNSVITPLEESINGVEGMDYMTSTASAGSVCRERAEPCVAGSGAVACRGDTCGCDGDEASVLTGDHVHPDV